jgi:hypothetical protein
MNARARRGAPCVRWETSARSASCSVGSEPAVWHNLARHGSGVQAMSSIFSTFSLGRAAVGHLVMSAAWASMLGACATENDPSVNSGPDGGSADARIADELDGASSQDGSYARDAHTATEAAVECCPPDPMPGCCMRYGGVKTDRNCESVCDGMPWPYDPAWRIVLDSAGCPRWSSQGAGDRCCGDPSTDAGLPRYSCYGDYGEPPRLLGDAAVWP